MINRILKKCFCFPRFTVRKRHHSQGLRWEACVHWRNVRGRDLLCGKLFQKQPVCLRNRRRNRVPSSQGQVMLRVSEVRWDPVTAYGGQGSHLSGFTFPSTLCRSKCFYSKVLPCGVLLQNLEKKLISYFRSKVLDFGSVCPSQASSVLPCDFGKVLPSVQCYEDGPLATRPPLSHWPAQCQRSCSGGVCHLQRRAGSTATGSRIVHLLSTRNGILNPF